MNRWQALWQRVWDRIWPVPWWLRPWGVVLTQRAGFDALHERHQALAAEHALTVNALVAQRDVTAAQARQIAGMCVRVTIWSRGEEVTSTGWVRPGTWWAGHPGDGDWMRLDWQPTRAPYQRTRSPA